MSCQNMYQCIKEKQDSPKNTMSGIENHQDVSRGELLKCLIYLFTWRQFRILSSYLSRGMGMEAKHGMD